MITRPEPLYHYNIDKVIKVVCICNDLLRLVLTVATHLPTLTKSIHACFMYRVLGFIILLLSIICKDPD